MATRDNFRDQYDSGDKFKDRQRILLFRQHYILIYAKIPINSKLTKTTVIFFRKQERVTPTGYILGKKL